MLYRLRFGLVCVATILITGVYCAIASVGSPSDRAIKFTIEIPLLNLNDVSELKGWSPESGSPCPVSVEDAISLVDQQLRGNREEPRKCTMRALLIPHEVALKGAEEVYEVPTFLYWIVVVSPPQPIVGRSVEKRRLFVVTFDRRVLEPKP